MTDRQPAIVRLLVMLRDLALRWRIAILWIWAACFPLLMWLYWSPSTTPPTSIDGVELELDKPIHAATHGFMVALPTLLLMGRWRIPGIVAGFATAVVLEFGQLWAPGRSFEWFDLTANTIGALLGLYVALRVRAL